MPEHRRSPLRCRACPTSTTRPPPPLPVPVRFVLVDPAGTLKVREADSTAEPDDWGGLYQARLWAAVAEAVDPHRRQVTTAALEHDL